MTVLIHRPPQIVTFAVDGEKDLIQVPLVARSGPSTAELIRIGLAELAAPLPDALVGDADPALRQDQLHLAQAQAEDVVEPDRVADGLGREAMSGVGGGLEPHPASMPQPLRST